MLGVCCRHEFEEHLAQQQQRSIQSRQGSVFSLFSMDEPTGYPDFHLLYAYPVSAGNIIIIWFGLINGLISSILPDIMSSIWFGLIFGPISGILPEFRSSRIFGQSIRPNLKFSNWSSRTFCKFSYPAGYQI